MRNALQFRMDPSAELQDRLERTGVKIVPPDGRERRHAEPTDARNLASLHCKLDRTTALVAKDQFDSCTEQVADRKRMLGHRARYASCAKQRLPLKQIRKSINAGCPGNTADADDRLHIADPGEFRGVEFGSATAQQGLERNRVNKGREHAAVARRDIVKPIG